ncbi:MULTISPECIES: AraC family transcriptional regulator [unclassified Chelatococcus]|uniref:AraC family transcriptional regulator n=1 Tax=unclassified Chelatococcus TaxID=2638111 RepID=UPI001BD02428|nr:MULTISPECIES: AraC family transcriptional regulator [unclassified Chelatococcus]CAH1654923.1 DNA-binding domain-containing protein, AraC-type [Hyphomicrobiales bacterium]MBS7740313.1 AraC family transcriptional regulator [Chelatococcus sp. HY11]MBX3544857.1 AraC family transcriptional regulator [Chelatococcus sp.]MCO5078446.1 AraC family transcriptional regulator [Chelatococcus sp.]CAH1685268.1 DNA-binding domain-containing protein, AraC-type [Hyphomicrobiales bacterium]
MQLSHFKSSTSLYERSVPPGHIHLGVIKEIIPTLIAFGIDPAPLIWKVGLDLHIFENDSNVIPHATLGRLLTLCVAQTKCPHFGLLVGQRATILSLGLIGRLMRHCATVGEALRALAEHLVIQNRGAVPSFSIQDGTALFTFSVYQPAVESIDHITDGAIALTVNALRSLSGARWNPSDVLLPRMPPRDLTPYYNHFRAPIRFNQETASISLPERDLYQPIEGADPIIRSVLLENIQHARISLDSNIPDDIRRFLRTILADQDCTANGVAKFLALHRRTLARRLTDAGLSYRTISNEVRFEIARQLLEDTKMSLGEISAALGYSEASVFSRAFRRWSGCSPGVWRAANRTMEKPLSEML